MGAPKIYPCSSIKLGAIIKQHPFSKKVKNMKHYQLKVAKKLTFSHLINKNFVSHSFVGKMPKPSKLQILSLFL
jgi:hypothetical protein